MTGVLSSVSCERADLRAHQLDFLPPFPLNTINHTQATRPHLPSPPSHSCSPMSNPNAISIDVPAKVARPSQKRKGAPTGPPQIQTTNDDGSVASGSGSGGDPAAKKQKKFFRHRLPEEEKPEKEDKEVGVSKLKASLRQAKRFLNKVRIHQSRLPVGTRQGGNHVQS